MSSPIRVTSFSRLSFPARLRSIFMCAIERTSRSGEASTSGRPAVSSNRTAWFFPRVFAVIIAASANASSSRGFVASWGPWAIPTDTVIRPAPSNSVSARRAVMRRASRMPAPGARGGHDDRELLAADPADDVRRTDARAQDLAEPDQDLVPDTVPVDVVELLEVVDVEHEDGDRVVRTARARQLGPEAVVEVAVVPEPCERVGLSLVLEPRPDLGVVEREHGRIPAPLHELELRLAEMRVLANCKARSPLSQDVNRMPRLNHSFGGIPGPGAP